VSRRCSGGGLVVCGGWGLCAARVVAVAGVKAGRRPPRRGLALTPARGGAVSSSGSDRQRGASVGLGLVCTVVLANWGGGSGSAAEASLRRPCWRAWCVPATTRRAQAIARCRRLRAVVEAKLELGWSPPQIASWLVLEFPDDAEMRVARDDLPVAVRAVPGWAAQGADSLPADETQCPAPRRQGTAQRPEPHPGDGQHQ
jgi:hypothetical protein